MFFLFKDVISIHGHQIFFVESFDLVQGAVRGANINSIRHRVFWIIHTCGGGIDCIWPYNSVI